MRTSGQGKIVGVSQLPDIPSTTPRTPSAPRFPPLTLSLPVRMGIHHMVDRLLRPQERIDSLQIPGLELGKVEPRHQGEALGPYLRRTLLHILLVLIKAV